MDMTIIIACAGVLVSAIAALAGAIAIMWRRDVKTQADMKSELLKEIKKRDDVIDDLSKRIRKLEDDRLRQTSEHAQELKTLALQLAHVLGENRIALVQVAKALHDIGSMMPHAVPEPTIDRPKTDALVAKMITPRPNERSDATTRSYP